MYPSVMYWCGNGGFLPGAVGILAVASGDLSHFGLPIQIVEPTDERAQGQHIIKAWTRGLFVHSFAQVLASITV